jgi:polyphosphate glucokinase
MQVLGIDIGGSGIKGAPVNTQTGKLLADRIRIKTPKGAEPEPIAEVVAEIARSFEWKGPIGIGFPAPIKAGVTLMAANVSDKWIGTNADELFTKITGCDCTMINDADAAGLAEMKFGAGRGQPGTVIMITLGTGIGTAIFHRGNLLPNTEFGHLEMNGRTRNTAPPTQPVKRRPFVEEIRQTIEQISCRDGKTLLARPVHRRRRNQ